MHIALAECVEVNVHIVTNLQVMQTAHAPVATKTAFLAVPISTGSTTAPRYQRNALEETPASFN